MSVAWKICSFKFRNIGRQTLQNNESQDSTIKTINTCFLDSTFSILSLSQVFSLSLTLFYFIANVNILAAVRLG